MTVTAVITCMTDGELPFIAQAVQSVLYQSCNCDAIVVAAHNRNSVISTLGHIGLHPDVRTFPLAPVGKVRNLAIQECRSEWIAFLDGDDVWRPEKIKKQMQATASGNHDAIGCRHVLIREDGRPFMHGVAAKTPMPSAILTRRELVLAHPFTTQPWEDAEWWKRVSRVGRTLILNDYLLEYRVRAHSLSTSFAPAKRRKYRLSRLSQLPGVRAMMYHGSGLVALALHRL